MAVILNGILGPLSGKVGPVVGGMWKGIAYIKQYTIPANPNTTAQQTQRSRFAAAVLFAQALYTGIITPLWNVFAVKMSGFNHFIKENIAALAATTHYVTVSNVLSKGSLEACVGTGAVLAANDVTFTWAEETIGNGALTDDIDLFVVNTNTYVLYSTIDSYTRDDEGGVVDCGTETDESKLIGFVVSKKGSGSSYVVGDSSAFQCTA